jgi:glutamate-1-semialdehyde 2,1-aminomutase
MPVNTVPGPKSRAAFSAAKKRIPGGLTSPVRAWARLGGKPPVIRKGAGAWVTDLDGRHYLDYVLSWGPLIHGHAHPAVVKAVTQAAVLGLSFGAPTAAETELAELLCSALPGMQQVRMVNSGTEATMSALRLARAATGRDLIIKCDGCYHGHADHLLVAAGSGAATHGRPDSAGVPAAFAEKTLVVPYNDAAAVAKLLRRHRKQVAALIVEPVAGNLRLVLPRPGYLAALREACTAAGTLLVFDEVMTGFRTCYGGYQSLAKVRPDLTCLGKVIGGGLPAAAYGGPRDLMRHLAPDGGCYQAGTLSGNPVAVAAGLATLRLAGRKDFYPRLSKRLTGLITGMRSLAARHGVAWQAAQVGTMWGWFFSERPVHDFAGAAACDLAKWQAFTRTMLQEGVNLAPSPFEAAFFSGAHGQAEVEHTLDAADLAFAAAAKA